MRCKDNSRLRLPLPQVCRELTLGPIRETTACPAWIPERDQLPFAIDHSARTLWVYMDNEGTNAWFPIRKYAISNLQEINLQNVTNLGNVVRFPVAYDSGNGIVEGFLTLGELKELLEKTNL